MGLDMYLYARKYEGCCSWKDDYATKKVGFYPEELKQFAEEVDNRSVLSKYTMYKVGYWRKANAIHSWFVDKCGDGVDECQEIYVSEADLEELLENVNDVLEHHDNADSVLPTQSGFFFGSTNYDEWYFKDLEYTKHLLERLIPLVQQGDYDIIYQASW